MIAARAGVVAVLDSALGELRSAAVAMLSCVVRDVVIRIGARGAACAGIADVLSALHTCREIGTKIVGTGRVGDVLKAVATRAHRTETNSRWEALACEERRESLARFDQFVSDRKMKSEHVRWLASGGAMWSIKLHAELPQASRSWIETVMLCNRRSNHSRPQLPTEMMVDILSRCKVEDLVRDLLLSTERDQHDEEAEAAAILGDYTPTEKLALDDFGGTHANSIQLIRLMQGTTLPVLPFLIVARIVGEESQDLKTNMFWSPGAIRVMAEAVETYLVAVLREADTLAAHRDCRVVGPKDIKLAVKTRHAHRD